jgi:NADH-quinone oxidoreductase subunit B
MGVSNEELTFREKLGDHKRETIVVTDVPEEFVKELTPEKPVVPEVSTKKKEENA